MIERNSCLVSPFDKEIIAWRTIGMHRSYVSRLETSSRSMNRIRRSPGARTSAAGFVSHWNST
jgi:hypothetical protein